MADDHKLRQLDPTGEQGYAAWTLKQRPTALSCLRALQKKLSSSRKATPDWASGTAWVADRHHLVTRIATPSSGDGVAAQHVPAASPHGGASASALTKPAGAPPAAVAAQAAQPAARVGAAPAQLPLAAAAAGLQADLQGQQVRAVQTQHAPPAEQVAVVAEAPPPPPMAAAPLAASSGALQVARRACDMQKWRADNLQAALEASRVEIAQLHNCVASLRKACEASKASECALRVDLKAARSQLGKKACTDVSVQAGSSTRSAASSVPCVDAEVQYRPPPPAMVADMDDAEVDEVPLHRACADAALAIDFDSNSFPPSPGVPGGVRADSEMCALSPALRRMPLQELQQPNVGRGRGRKRQQEDAGTSCAPFGAGSVAGQSGPQQFGLEQLTYAELIGLVQRLGTAPPCSNRKWTESSVNTLLTAKYCPEVQRLICTCASDVPSVLKSNLDMLARERHALQYARQVQLDQTKQPFVFNVNVSFDKQSLQLLPQSLPSLTMCAAAQWGWPGMLAHAQHRLACAGEAQRCDQRALQKQQKRAAQEQQSAAGAAAAREQHHSASLAAKTQALQEQEHAWQSEVCGAAASTCSAC